MYKGLFAAVIFAMVFASPVHAEGSGGALLEICTSTDATSTAACRTYIHGVAETLHIWLDVDPETVRACIPASVSEDQLKDVSKISTGGPARWLWFAPGQRSRQSRLLDQG